MDGIWDDRSCVSIGEYKLPASCMDGETASVCCKNSATGEDLRCRTYDLKFFYTKMSLFSAANGMKGIHPARQIIFENTRALVISERTYEDLHQHLKARKRLTEVEAAHLFKQIATLVRDAHLRGIALGNIKIKKFAFEDPSKTQLSLLYLDDAQLMLPSGQISDKHNCPPYMCPEMLHNSTYSGRAADLWSLGVILYTLLVGHYPFFSLNTEELLDKVRSGFYHIPDHVSTLGRSVITSLLRYEPDNRVPAWAILEHPWFEHALAIAGTGVHHSPHRTDQIVPN